VHGKWSGRALGPDPPSPTENRLGAKGGGGSDLLEAYFWPINNVDSSVATGALIRTNLVKLPRSLLLALNKPVSPRYFAIGDPKLLSMSR
jgi:hypothetical protein